MIHGVREVKELAYHDYITKELPEHELLGELVRDQLLYYPTVTREPFKNQGRVTDLIENGKLFSDLNMPIFNPSTDRVMICGSPQLLKDLKKILEDHGGDMDLSNPQEGGALIEIHLPLKANYI